VNPTLPLWSHTRPPDSFWGVRAQPYPNLPLRGEGICTGSLYAESSPTTVVDH